MKMLNRTMMTAGLFAMLVVTSAYGQVATSLHVNVPFKFRAGDKVLPAGGYHFENNREAPWLTVRSAGDNTVVRVRVITLLAREASSADSSRLVFDKEGDQNILSEVWLPGRDGLLVNAAHGEHKHEVVRGSK